MAYPGIVLMVMAGVAVGSMLYYLFSSPLPPQHQYHPAAVRALTAPPPRPNSRRLPPVRRRRKSSNSEPSGRENIEICSICCENLFNNDITGVPVVTPCDHYFHSVCIKQWIRVQNWCPNCKEKIPFNLTL